MRQLQAALSPESYRKGKRLKFKFEPDSSSPYVRVTRYDGRGAVSETYWIVGTDLPKWRNRMAAEGLTLVDSSIGIAES